MQKIFRGAAFFLAAAFIGFLIGLFYRDLWTGQTITIHKIQSAEELIGLSFSDVKRDSMLDALNEQSGNFGNIHKVELNNDVPPAILFNPIPRDMKMDIKEKYFRLTDYSGTKAPESSDELAFYSIGQLAEMIRTKKITSLELTQMYLDRLKKYDPKLECVITLTEDLALEQARRADSEIASGKYRGPLHGIPYGAKDLLAVKGYKTTWGATPYKDQIIDENAAVIQKLDAAGAVLVAKLTMGALAWGEYWYGGMTRNPWDITQGSSGSSAGSAAATSAGLVPFAIGTETWGSIISPSTVCGVTGLRPTYGRVSRSGAMALSWSMDKIGPICRDAEDCAIVLNAINGPDGKDQTVYDLPFNYDATYDIRKLRVGYIEDDFKKDYDFKTNDSLALGVFRNMGIELIPIKLPELPVADLGIILSAEAGAAFDELTRSGKDDLLVRQVKNAWPNVFRASRFIPAVEYINANRIRYQLIQEMNDLMKTVDIYLAPSWEGDNLLLTNLTGHPAIVMPNGFSEDGTPTSITITGNLFREGELISAAKAYQSATDYHLKHPPLKWD
ncbi:MAG: amidase [Calditrichaceae bacterium]